MDPIWIVAAFLFGAASSRIGLPPLVGYLIAGFVLNSLGVESSETLEKIADTGVTLLLFTIGLKLKLKSLARPEVWAGATIHMFITVAVFATGIWALGVSEVPYFRLLGYEKALLIAFALSFSSTVFAVKVLEEKKEMASRHAAVAIGILIVQDIIAVAFLAASAGKVPSPWAIVLGLSLFIIRPVVARFIGRCGHGELLMLFGILMAAAGFGSFELVGLKGDLGALVFGMLLAGHPKAPELAERLLSFKDLFLVGFFLNIGISGSLTLPGFLVALLLALAMPLKTAMFFGLLTRFRLRARTSMLASLSLSNYSEFGLIVGSIGVASGWITSDWLVIIAIALSITFIWAAPLNAGAHSIYANTSTHVKRFETSKRLPEDELIESGDAEIAIVGMGGVGTSAYDEMRRRYGDVVIGVDFSADKVENHQKLGRNVIYGDAEDSDFWQRVEPAKSRVELVMLALPEVSANTFAIRQMRRRGYQGQITASVRYEDEIYVLKQEGIDAAYSLFEEAGVGFADHVCDHMDYCKLKEARPTS
ncbi:MAG: cation:proton antiporter family protein [Thermodesulfobacteriota bacterium]|nr:cation:proton antiporter family protein [Thermodesulfobacteriota bacterium]